MPEPHVVALWVVGALALFTSVVLSSWFRHGAVAIYAISLWLLYLTAEGTLGWPVPISWADYDREMIVHYADVRPSRGIYLLVETSPVPRWIRLPYSEKAARHLRGAVSNASGKGVPLMFRYEPNWDDRRPLFYPAPQEADPPKDSYTGEEWHL